MKSGIFLVNDDKEGVFSGIDPERLADLDDVWKHDVSLFLPWHFRQEAIDGKQYNTWHSQRYNGPANIWITGTCTSSMDVARVLIEEKRMAPWSSVLVARQTAGRGQRKRSWISPAGNIYGTWFWTFDGEKASRYKHLASLLAGDILASVFREMNLDVAVKWPNDIVLDNHKLCGILVEERGGQMLVGIGINLVSAPTASVFHDDFVLPAACLNASGMSVTPLSFWEKLVTVGKERFERITTTMSPEAFLADLETNMAWIDADIRVRVGNESPFVARLLGIAPDGGLKLLRDGHVAVIYAATIRPLEPVARF